MSSNNDKNTYEIWQETGILTDAAGYLMTFFFIGPFTAAVDMPWYLLEMKRQKAEQNLESGYMVQEELNELYDNYTIDYSLIYTKVNLVWHISLFVTPIFPMAPLGVVFFAVVTYWI